MNQRLGTHTNHLSTWADMVRVAARELEQAGVPSAWHDAQALAAYAQGVDISRAITNCAPSDSQAQRFYSLCHRRQLREPLQHILGTMWFRYLELESRPGVFIVRPETELVAQAGIDALQCFIEHGREDLVAVDLFTGSGAIALSMATELKNATSELTVYGVEKSLCAYQSAQRNNARYGNLVHFIHADACEKFSPDRERTFAEKTALVIANPPYVPPYHELSPEVQADPNMALFGGGADGLDIPLQALRRSWQLLMPGGALVMEHASEQAHALRTAAYEQGFVHISTGRDLAGNDRWLEAYKPQI